MPRVARHELHTCIPVHHQNLGVLTVFGRGRVDVQVTELTAQCLVLLERQLLVAKEQHEVRHQGLVNRLERLWGERRGQIDAGYLGANHGRDGIDMHDVEAVAAHIVCGWQRRGKSPLLRVQKSTTKSYPRKRYRCFKSRHHVQIASLTTA